MSGVLETIAEWAGSARPPETARRRARLLVTDQIGVSVAGGFTGVPVSTSDPVATIWATGRRVHWIDAALVNRLAGDDLELVAGPEVVGAAFAAAEIEDRTLAELDAAVALACDVEEYLRGWLQSGIESHGLHPPALLGAISSAVAAARLLGLEDERFAGALTAAAALAPVSPYVAFSRGATGKRLYGAWSQMVGASCASLAGRGIAGPGRVLEGRRGIAQALLDAGGATEPPRFAPDGRAVERVTFKAYPASRACHAALTAVEGLGAIDPDAIERVDVWSYPFSVELDRRTLGETPIGAQMSLKKSLALFLLFGELRYRAVSEPAVAELAARVHVRELGGGGEAPRVRRARVRLTLADGRRLESEAEAKWGAHRPATESEIRDRFLRLTAGRRAPDPWELPDETRISWLMSSYGR